MSFPDQPLNRETRETRKTGFAVSVIVKNF